jgi:hypothetical protein
VTFENTRNRLSGAACVPGAAMMAAVPAAAQEVDTINVLTPYEEYQGFELMFDGTASSFRDKFVNYQRNNTANTNLHSGWNVNSTLTDPDRPGAFFHAIVNSGVSGNANIDIRSTGGPLDGKYRDFDFRMEYRNSGNQGIFYRFDVSGQYAWETGIEYAIDDNITQSETKFRAGAAYDLFPPSSQEYFVRSTNRWNSVRIVVKGDSVEQWMNGVKVVGFRYWSPEFLTAFQNSKWTGFNRFCQTAPNNREYIPEGYLGFQGDHGGAWQIRRMRILHDWIPGMDRVRHGPVDTTVGGVSLTPGREEMASVSHRIERLPGALRIVTIPEARLNVVELRGLDGRLVRRAMPGATHHTFETNGLRNGVYLLRMETEHGSHSSRVLVH